MEKDNKNQSPLIGVISLVVVIGLGIFIYSLISNDTKGKDEVYSIVNGEKTTKETYEVLEKVYCKDTEFTVTDIQEKTYSQDKGVTKGKKLIAVTYKIKNTSDKERTFSSSDFEVVSSNGEVKTPFMAVITSMWKGEFLKSPTLSPGGEKEGYLTYELNENDTDYTIQYQCTIKFNFDKVYIKVK